MIRLTAVLTAALLALTGCDPGRPVHQAEWTPVPGATWITWLCDGPNLLYRTASGNAFAVAPNDPRCKP